MKSSLLIKLIIIPYILSGCAVLDLIDMHQIWTSDEGVNMAPLSKDQFDPVMVKTLIAALCHFEQATISPENFKNFSNTYTQQPIRFMPSTPKPYSYIGALSRLSPDGSCEPVIECLLPIAMEEIPKGGFPYAQYYRLIVLEEILSLRRQTEVEWIGHERLSSRLDGCSENKKTL